MKYVNLTVGFAALLFASQLFAGEYLVKPYIGAHVKVQRMGLQSGYGRDSFKKNIPGMDVVLGARVHNALSLEVGTHFSKWAKLNGNQSRHASTFGRALGHLPLSDRMDFLFGMGLSFMNLDFKLKGIPQAHMIRKPVPHAVIGTKVNLTDWAAIRLLGSVESTKSRSSDVIRTNHGHALHGGLVASF
jgi:hypothetical protein